MRRFVFLFGVVVSARAFGQASNATAPAEWEGIRPPFHRDLDAMVSLPGGSALLFRGDDYGQYDPVKRSLTSGPLRSLPGWPKNWKSPDAAARWTDEKVILVRGGEYVLYDTGKRTFSGPASLSGWTGWPAGWADGIDAAVEASDHILYFFRGPQYLTLDKSTLEVRKGPSSIRDWNGWPARWLDGIDAADNPGDGYVYFFRGSEYLAYDLRRAAFVRGHPRPIPGQPPVSTAWPPVDPNSVEPAKRPMEWKNLKPPFQAGLPTLVSLDKERTLVFRDGAYGLYLHKRGSNGEEDAGLESGALAGLPGWPASWTDVHAAAKWTGGSVILFHEGKYLIYDPRDRRVGPEKNLSDLSGWPEGWKDGIDAALEDDDGDSLYLFRGPVFLTLSRKSEEVAVAPSPLIDWMGFPGSWKDGIDGADNPGDGKWYFFRGHEVLAWDTERSMFLEGYPKALPGAAPPAVTLSSTVWPPVGAAAPATKPGSVPALTFAGLAAGMGGPVDAGAPIGGDHLLVFRDDRYGIYNTATGTVTQTGAVNTIPGWPEKWKRVDAVAAWDDLTLILFSGGEYIQYNVRKRSFRGEADIVSNLPNWPLGWVEGVTGAASLEDDVLYLFHGSSYVTMSKSGAAVVTEPDSTKLWKGWPDHWKTGATGTVEGTDGRVYFLRGGEFLPYDPELETFAAGGPKQLPGTSADITLAAWPPLIAPPVVKAADESGGGANGGGTITEANGQLRVTSVIPLDRGERVSGVNTTALNVTTNRNRSIPVLVGDPARFDLDPKSVINSSGADPGAAKTGGDGAAVTRFRDDYPVNNTFEWNIPWVTKGADYLGGGYDPLKLNPANYGDVTQRAPFQAVKLTTSFRRNLDGTLAAYCSEYSPGNTGRVSTKNSTVTTLKEYQDHYEIDASVMAGVAGVGKSTMAGGYSELNNAKNGRDQIRVMRQATIGLLRIRMDPTCLDPESGEPYRQKLDLGFRARVKSLPDAKVVALPRPAWLADPSAYEAGLRAWRASLPKTVLDPYVQLLNDYGYAVATSVTLGGQFRSKMTITKSLYEKSNRTGVRFQRDVEATIEGMQIGQSVAYQKGNFSKADKGQEAIVSENETSGGQPAADFDSWAPTVSQAPVPVKAQFRPLADFITTDFFPEDAAIDSKAQLLRALAVTHMVADGPPLYAAEGRDEFYNQPPRTYELSFVKASANLARYHMPEIHFSILNPNFEKTDFQVAGVGSSQNVLLSAGFFGDPAAEGLFVEPKESTVKSGSTVTITVPANENRLHFWGLSRSYQFTRAEVLWQWPRIDDKITSWDPADPVLSDLTLENDGSAVTTVPVTFSSGSDHVTFEIKVKRIK